MEGVVTKALADFYYVFAEGKTYQCKAKGIFKKHNLTPLVGDKVEIELTNAEDIEGKIVSIHTRKNQLNRPSVANIDTMLVVFAIADPKPNLYLLDRFLAIIENLDLDIIIVFNKLDICKDEEYLYYKSLYNKVGYNCILTSTFENTGITELKESIQGKRVSVAGPSGVGKSSIINALLGISLMEIGQISRKNKRGKQTTRHTELVYLGDNTFIVDTPGFSSTNITDIEIRDLDHCFAEFREHIYKCRFSTCSHLSEPDCGILSAVEAGYIYISRYESYQKMYNEIKDTKKY